MRSSLPKLARVREDVRCTRERLLARTRAALAEQRSLGVLWRSGPRGHRNARDGLFECERPLAVRPYDDVIALAETPFEHRHGQRILNHRLDRPLQRTRAERRIVPFLGDEAL